MQQQRIEWLRPQMDNLFEKKKMMESKGKDLNTSIQSGREYRNPRIGEKLIETYNIKQYGSNFSKDQFDPDKWAREASESFYDSRMYRKLVERREREKREKV